MTVYAAICTGLELLERGSPPLGADRIRYLQDTKPGRLIDKKVREARQGIHNLAMALLNEKHCASNDEASRRDGVVPCGAHDKMEKNPHRAGKIRMRVQGDHRAGIIIQGKNDATPRIFSGRGGGGETSA